MTSDLTLFSLQLLHGGLTRCEINQVAHDGETVNMQGVRALAVTKSSMLRTVLKSQYFQQERKTFMTLEEFDINDEKNRVETPHANLNWFYVALERHSAVFGNTFHNPFRND